MEHTITQEATYDQVLDFLNSVEDIDGMLLDCLEDAKPAIKIISGDVETSYDYDNFLEIFDNKGLDGFVY